jgi:UPF0271 protein
MKVFILDTSAFIQGFSSSAPDTLLYTTPKIVNEIKEEITKLRIENWSQTGKLVIMSPTTKLIEHVKKQAEKSGDINYLSTTDLSILAITYQLKIDGLNTLIISDDYSIQNLADFMGLCYRGMITHGIEHRFMWITYCPGCKKQYNKHKQLEICTICGTELKRKPGKKTRVRDE